jgi:hypothetical protein
MRQYKDNDRENYHTEYVPHKIELKEDDQGELELAQEILKRSLGITVHLVKKNPFSEV